MSVLLVDFSVSLPWICCKKNPFPKLLTTRSALAAAAALRLSASSILTPMIWAILALVIAGRILVSPQSFSFDM